MVLILGVETSCDETAAAVVEDGVRIRASVVASQIDIHRQYGGVFPEVASRIHVEAISAVVRQAVDEAQVTPGDINAIAVTRGPGLAGSLVVGVNFAKGLAFGWNKPLIGINHIEGHIYSLWLTEHADRITFPLLVLVVSGGHTELLLMADHGQYRMLGYTLDDAAGEAFDKVGRMLGLPYPGGPAIERAARDGNPAAYPFKRPMRDDENLNFSFSGLKTAVMRAVQLPPASGKRTRGEESMDPNNLKPGVKIADVAASFQQAAIDMLVDKTAKAAHTYEVNEILIAGGVSANQLLRQEMKRRAGLPVRYPPLNLCTDNAAMIAAAGYFRYRAGQRDDFSLDVEPMLGIVGPETD